MNKSPYTCTKAAMSMKCGSNFIFLALVCKFSLLPSILITESVGAQSLMNWQWVLKP